MEKKPPFIIRRLHRSNLGVQTVNSFQDQQKAELEANLESWCNKLLTMSFEVGSVFSRVWTMVDKISTGSYDSEKNLAVAGIFLHHCAQQERAFHAQSA